MNKHFSYHAERIVDTIPINDELVAYSDRYYKDGELDKEIEGIASKEHIENLTRDEEIANYRAKVRADNVVPIRLYFSEIREVVRTISFGSEKAREAFEKYYISHPYSYLKNCDSKEGIELLYLSYYDHNLYDGKFEIQPKAVYFDYMNGSIDNERYDLNEVMTILKKRDDIMWVGEPGIKDIPYYNRDEDRQTFLAFYWIPKDEDFKQIRDTINNPVRRHDNICKKIFKLTKKE